MGKRAKKGTGRKPAGGFVGRALGNYHSSISNLRFIRMEVRKNRGK